MLGYLANKYIELEFYYLLAEHLGCEMNSISDIPIIVQSVRGIESRFKVRSKQSGDVNSVSSSRTTTRCYTLLLTLLSEGFSDRWICEQEYGLVLNLLDEIEIKYDKLDKQQKINNRRKK